MKYEGKERVNYKEKSLKQDLTIAKDLILMLPEGRYSSHHRLG